MSKRAKIFIDGAAGTTGLEIRERLAGRAELSLIALSDAERKDQAARKKALNEADLVILCLPDEAAREAVTLIDNPATRVIDASTAHRVADGWDFGFAELEPDGYQPHRRVQAGEQSGLLVHRLSRHRAAAGARRSRSRRIFRSPPMASPAIPAAARA